MNILAKPTVQNRTGTGTATTVYPVILCGGSGKRLWPVSRAGCPKQFQRLNSDLSLLQETVRRAGTILDLPAPLILCNEEHRYMVRDHLSEIGVEPAAIVCEPVSRNTAAALTTAALLLREQDPDCAMLAMPADHHIADEEAFRRAVEAARDAAGQGHLVTFGIQPSRPETGYGYIEQGHAIDGVENGHKVARFLEKPDRERAEELIESGNYLWNSGIFLLPAGLFLDEVRQHDPEVELACSDALTNMKAEDGCITPKKSAFAQAPDRSVDVAVMERTDHAAVVRTDMAWSDIGTWPALGQTRSTDDAGNVLVGNAVVEDASNCLIHGNGRLVAAFGLKDVVIVDTEDAVLVSSVQHTAQVDRLVGRLRKSGVPEADQHARVERPWGAYQTVESGERFQVKHILVKPGQQLSLQMHHHRAEHWIVVRGTGRVTRGDKQELIRENESVHIPVGTSHRLENPGVIPLHLIEVQVGAYLGEDDIVRFEDRYGRAS